jgi:hypothetical protein
MTDKAQAFLKVLIDNDGDASCGHLGQELGYGAEHTRSRFLGRMAAAYAARLQKLGLVSKYDSFYDRGGYTTIVEITEKGRKAYADHQSDSEQQERRVQIADGQNNPLLSPLPMPPGGGGEGR